MAASSNTTWSKGFSGNPTGETRGDLPLGELVGAIGGEWVAYPTGGDDALQMTRREALARTLWTRGVIDGDMTAIKLLVELLEGKGAADEAGGDLLLTADQLAAAEAALKAWGAELAQGATKEAGRRAPSGQLSFLPDQAPDEPARGETEKGVGGNGSVCDNVEARG